MSRFYPTKFRVIPVLLVLLQANYGMSSAKAEYRTGDLNFSLQVEHNETRWQYANTALTSKSDKLGIQIRETLSPRIRGTLYAGYLDLSQPGNPLPAARVTTGYYAGIDLSLLLLDLSRLNLELTGGYAYQNTDGSDSDTTVEFAWHNSYVQLGLGIPLAAQLTLRATGGMVNTSGEQRISGTGSQLLTYEEQQQNYYSAGLDYRVDNSGDISLRWLWGSSDGFRIAFRRGF